MHKKYQAFVSSTYIDLIEERKEVIQALLELDCIPVGMELFPAADEDQWSLIKRLIEDCDYYILIVGGRYGSLNEEGVGYTEMEYDYAVSQGIPIISFLHKNPDKIAVGKTDRNPELIEKLTHFKKKVQQKMCRYWETPSELGSVVSRSLIKLIRDKPGIGWVKASTLPSEELTKEVLELKRRNEELQHEIVSAAAHAPKGTENLSQGDDKVKLKYSFWAYRNDEWEVSFVRSSDAYSGEFETTWNELFAEISPLMINEACESSLKSKLDAYCHNSNFSNNEGLLKQYRRIGDFRIDENDFHLIKIQLRALGLIAKSEKKRSARDNDTYWQLTPYGDNIMTRLLAVKKNTNQEIKE